MASPVVRVVLLSCGSFNPVTNMHLRMFELARDFLNSTGNYNVIGGIISPVCDAYIPRATKQLVPSKHRCAMIRLALKSTSWIQLDTWESEQNQWMETVPVLRHCRDVILSSTGAPTGAHSNLNSPMKNSQNINNIDSFGGWFSNMTTGGEGPVQLKMLCGADILESFLKPKLYKDSDIREIVSQYGMIVISRSGSHPLDIIYESDILTRHRNNIEIVNEWIPNDISSTKVRTALRRGQSVKYLLHDAVIEYIYRNHLYGTSSTSSVASTDSCLSSATDET